MNEYTKLLKYTFIFVIVYYILYGLLTFYNDTEGYQYIQQKTMPSVEYMAVISMMYIVILIAPIVMIMNTFVKDRNRVPNKSEKIKLVAMFYVLSEFASVPYLYVYRGYVGNISDFHSYLELPFIEIILIIGMKLLSVFILASIMFFFCGWSSKIFFKRNFPK